ncbi:MAG: arsenite efflux transporter metallochaperone ArsD [Bacillus sp. (in: Bacteria)]|nr:arsenite efflux transporter metallochaperone ArsD [Bacillus sp. (in: firmicutes)]
MKKVEIFDPAMCCSTGVCGPSVDPELTRVAAAIFVLEKKGFPITRYQLTNDPDRFADNQEIQRLLTEKGPDALPVVMVDGKVEKVGAYPTNEEFAAWFEVKLEELSKKPKAKLSINVKQS